VAIEDSPEWQVRYEVVLMGEYLECWAFFKLCEDVGVRLSYPERLALTAFFEAHLLHVRNVIEFLSAHARKQGFLCPQRWVASWEGSRAAKQFSAQTKRLNTELAHLSDTRQGGKLWLPLADAAPVIAMYEEFARQATGAAERVRLLQEAAMVARQCLARSLDAEAAAVRQLTALPPLDE
jgi:hypothetical protein